jgi:hypothetical protein
MSNKNSIGKEIKTTWMGTNDCLWAVIPGDNFTGPLPFYSSGERGIIGFGYPSRREFGTLFTSYEAARNAIRRHAREYGGGGLKIIKLRIKER